MAKENKKAGAQKAPVYSFTNTVRNKDKNGRNIYFKKVGKKKIRTSQAEWLRVQHTKKYYKVKYPDNWSKKLNEARRELINLDKKSKAHYKKLEPVKLLSIYDKAPEKFEPQQTFANSMPTDVEMFVLNYGACEIQMHQTEITENAKGKKYKDKKIDTVKLPNLNVKVTQKNLMEARSFFSEIADEFYKLWHALDEAGTKVDSPNIYFTWQRFKTEEKGVEIFIYLDRTVFSFYEVYFFKYMIKQFKVFFGK